MEIRRMHELVEQTTQVLQQARLGPVACLSCGSEKLCLFVGSSFALCCVYLCWDRTRNANLQLSNLQNTESVIRVQRRATSSSH